MEPIPFCRKSLNYFELLRHVDAKCLNKVWKLSIGFHEKLKKSCFSGSDYMCD